MFRFMRKQAPSTVDGKQASGRPARSDGESVPKNGRLMLMVVASFLLMLVLAVCNFKLIGDPSVAVKAFGPPSMPAPTTEERLFSCPASAGSGEEERYDPPKVTFYSKLTAQEEPPRQEGDHGMDSGPEGARTVDNSAASGDAPSEWNAGETSVRGEDLPAQTGPRSREKRADPQPLPHERRGSPCYAVHVGTFSHPAIAQQWARKWKARGHTVRMKPVARPGTGATYRLYLGRFRSKKEADGLIRRLKKKEGITAFRVAIRN